MNTKLKEVFSQQYNLKKGAIIKTSRSLSESIFLLKEGFVKESIVESSGAEMAIRILRPEIIFPFTQPNEKDSIQYIYEAYTDVILFGVAKEKFRDLVNSNPELFKDIQLSLLEQVNLLKKRLFYLNTGDALTKVVFILDYLAEVFSGDQENEKIVIPLSQKEIGSFVGLSRESVGMQIKKIVEKGEASFEHNTLTIHKSLSFKRI